MERSASKHALECLDQANCKQAYCKSQVCRERRVNSRRKTAGDTRSTNTVRTLHIPERRPTERFQDGSFSRFLVSAPSGTDWRTFAAMRDVSVLRSELKRSSLLCGRPFFRNSMYLITPLIRQRVEKRSSIPKNSRPRCLAWIAFGSLPSILRRRRENGRRIPHGLLEKIVAFAKQYAVDCTPINDFQNSIDSIAAREAKTLGLRSFEVRPVLADFKATLKRRRTCKLPWSKGWPLIKHSDDSQTGNWGLHYYFNQTGIDSELLESGRGVPGLTFGRALAPSSTGHESLVGIAAKRSLREAAILSLETIASGGNFTSACFSIDRYRQAAT